MWIPGYPKVDELDYSVARDEDIARADVPMSNTEVVNVSQSLEKLEEYGLCGCLMPLWFQGGERSSRDEGRPFGTRRKVRMVQEGAEREIISRHVKFIVVHDWIVERSE